MINNRSAHFSQVKKQHNHQKNIPLTKQDEELLALLTSKYLELGRSPTTAEIPRAGEFKKRFGNWKNALSAANLPALNDPQQQKLRQKKQSTHVESTSI